MASTSALKIQDDKLSSLGLNKMVVNKEQVTTYSRALGVASEKNPILVLIHGYPESAFMWRHLVPLLPSNAPIFAPDLPGYGGSAVIEKNDKLSVGNVVLSALKTEVPTSVQWQHYASPLTAAKEVTGYFHWPLLANVDLATRMITAFGGSNWCQEMILRWAGDNPEGLSSLKSDDALTVYGAFFDQPHTLRASCEDYKEGATTDVERAEQDQKEGKKIKIPTCLIYSESYLGSRYKFPEVWNDWIEEGVDVQHHGLGNGMGHFGVEEAPEESANVIGTWLARLGEKS
ncbi:hypothetical protein N0V83_002049 [Neocucurbitaria cava]|uniref:AB hydrolase-1 domain-containing protein n=1 Tax=Neocucurbitaria cava TaxID=798079 RepID=A0A9W8YG98_9PLEO|nr:hypothetical protein N0V83_002049 [Neocucurbitaria cava]